MPDAQDSRPLNILFIPGWYPSDQKPVAGNLIREHAIAASRHNNVVVLYVTRIETGVRGKWRLTGDRIEEGLRTVRVEWRPLPIPLTSFIMHLMVFAAAYRYIRSSGFSPDVIHGHVYFYAPAAVFLGKVFRKPVVITERSPAFLLGDVKGRMLAISRAAFRLADMILPVSAWLQENMEALEIHGRYRVVPNAFDPALFFPAQAPPGSETPQSIPRLMTVGLLTKPKGIPVLLRAVHQLKERGRALHLDIVGDGMERSDYEGMCLELGLQEYVTFHGMKSKNEIASMIQQSSFYLQPSLWETFCAALVEAMACGKPIVATRIPVFVEKVDTNMGILVPPGDENALALAIEQMLDSFHSYSAELIAGYAHAHYSYQAVAVALNDVYREVHRAR